jgi:aryl-alcohol dehydrogenase-like predicted oxidoreductase
MYKLPLGLTGEMVSAICLGILPFGSRLDKKESFNLLDRYVYAGGNFFDTANSYNRWMDGFVGGESETILGQWMHQRKNRRKMFVATKVGFEYQDVDRCLHADIVIAECEKSLKRMQTDVIDLFYAHTDDRTTPVEETMEAFNHLVKTGKVRYVGASNLSTWRLEQARWICKLNGWTPYCCAQQRYSYLRAKPGAYFDAQVMVDDDMLDYARTTGITLLAFSPLLNGAYARSDRPFSDQYLGPDTCARLQVLYNLADEAGVTPNQVVLAWMLHHQSPVIPIMGVSSEAQIEENLGALEVKLSPEQVARLHSAGT